MNWAKQHEGTGGKLVLDWERLHGRFAANPGEQAKVTLAKRLPMPRPMSEASNVPVQQQTI